MPNKDLRAVSWHTKGSLYTQSGAWIRHNVLWALASKAGLHANPLSSSLPHHRSGGLEARVEALAAAARLQADAPAGPGAEAAELDAASAEQVCIACFGVHWPAPPLHLRHPAFYTPARSGLCWLPH